MGSTAFTWERSSDGTYTVRGVPIFELGDHRGFRYDESWARKALRNFARLRKERDFLPPVILGHTRGGGDEKPAVGFMDRLRLIGGRIVADLRGIGQDLFNEIRAGRWPYRSVEVFDRDAQITALALLGGTPPYMKTEPLHFADDGAAGIWIDSDTLPEIAAGGQPNNDDHSPSPDGGHVKADQETPGGVPRKFSQADVDTLLEQALAEERERFRATEDELQSAKGRLEQLEADAKRNEQQTFARELAKLGYAPAVVEAPEMGALVKELMDGSHERFAAGEPSRIALLAGVLRLIAERQHQNRAFVDLTEQAPAHQYQAFLPDDETPPMRFDGAVDPASLERYRRAREVSTAEGISFRQALERVLHEHTSEAV